MSRFTKLRPSPALAVAVAAMVVAVAGVAVAGPVAHESIGKKKIKSIARAIAQEEVAKSAVRTATIAANGALVSGSGIAQANVTHPSNGNYCINGLTPGIKDAQVTLDYAETGFKSQVFITVGGGGGCTGKQLWISTYNDTNVLTNARLHLAVFAG